MVKVRYKRRTGQIVYAITVVLVLALMALVVMPVYAAMLFLDERFEQPQHNSLDYGIESERVTLTTSDNLNLAAWRTYAAETEEDSAVDDAEVANDTTPHGTVIILSGIQQPSVTEFFGYAQMLSQHGWDALLIEKRARSLSEGESIGFGFTEWKDVQAGVNYLEADSRVQDLPIIVMGTSAGGATVLTAAGEIPRIDGVISISGYTSFTDAYVDNIVEMRIPRIVADASRPFMNLFLDFRLGNDATQKTPLAAVKNLGERPLLLMHSTEDHQVPFTHFEQFSEAAKDAEVSLNTFTREGDWHFVCYDRYFDNPAQDTEFSQAIFEFLDQFEE